MNGLSDKTQAELTFVSAVSVTVAASAAVLPVPDQAKPYWILFWGLLGALGFAIKEALGSTPPAPAAKTT
jgi:hypothetical protein